MPWIATVTTDSDKTDVGTATAIFTDPATSKTFTFSRRAKLNTADKAAFVSEAKAALATEDNKVTRDDNLSAALTKSLNA